MKPTASAPKSTVPKSERGIAGGGEGGERSWICGGVNVLPVGALH